MSPSYVPARGDIIWMNFDPQTGHEQRGHRPALVLSPSSYNAKSSLAIVCPITSQGKGYPFEIRIPTGLAVAGYVLSDQFKNVDWQARKAQFADTLPPTELAQVLDNARLLISS